MKPDTLEAYQNRVWKALRERVPSVKVTAIEHKPNPVENLRKARIESWKRQK